MAPNVSLSTLLFLFMVVATSLFGREVTQEKLSEFDDIVDFSITLRELSERARQYSGDPVENDALFVVDGYIVAITVVQDTEHEFSAIIELMSGEWEENLDRVHAYRARLTATGEQYRDRISTRPMRNPGRDAIVAGRRGIAVVRLERFETNPATGRRLPVLETLHFRAVQ